ncbi:MAG: LysR substrate-binding domain-containing protein [Rubrivivax sp.]
MKQLDAALAREGIRLRRKLEVALPLTTLGMVRAGLGIAVLTTNVTPLASTLGLVTRKLTRPVVRRRSRCCGTPSDRCRRRRSSSARRCWR